jgi:hypothetical protein
MSERKTFAPARNQDLVVVVVVVVVVVAVVV